MSIRAKDVYRVMMNDNLSEDGISSLLTLYLPIIGNDAVLLYLLLHSEGRLSRTQEPHSRIFELLNRSPQEIEQARIHLEEYMLLRTYVQEGENRSSFLYHLNAPLPSESFLSSREFLAAYTRAAGTRQADSTVAKFVAGNLSTSGYQDITASVRKLPSERDYDAAVSFQRITPKYSFAKKDIDINFDYDRFFLTTSDLVFPNVLRTRENLQLIGTLATLHGLSADKMRTLVGRCVDIESSTLNTEMLKEACEKAVPDITKARDMYTLPPVSFLMAKQNGAMVSRADRVILEKLKMDMHFSNEVINVMIEYILKRSDNRLNSRFVDMIAGEWARDGVKTREEALAETQKTVSAGSRRRDVLPDYYNADPNRTAETEKSSDAEVAQLKELLKGSGKDAQS